jgi:hypothetical protein
MGLITSNFSVRAGGEVVDNQFAQLLGVGDERRHTERK